MHGVGVEHGRGGQDGRARFRDIHARRAFGALRDPLAQRRQVGKLGGVPGVGGEFLHRELPISCARPLLHLLDFDDADGAEVSPRRAVSARVVIVHVGRGLIRRNPLDFQGDLLGSIAQRHARLDHLPRLLRDPLA